MKRLFKTRWVWFWQGWIHSFIVWYLRNWAGGAFHSGNWGTAGRYVVLMNETEYSDYNLMCVDLPRELDRVKASGTAQQQDRIWESDDPLEPDWVKQLRSGPCYCETHELKPGEHCSQCEWNWKNE